MKAIRLRTEHLKEAMGVDFSHPELTWNCEGGIRQTAWRILAVSGKETVWDSGKVAGSSMRAEYPHALSSRQRVAWKVKLWDEKDEEGEWSEEASFEMGLLSPDDWKAQWLTGNYRVDPKLRYPVDCFQKKFKAKGVTKARLYATACGIYEVRINGQKAGNFCLAPGHTDYKQRIQYQTADVTDLVREGENEITAELADGWYRGSCGAWGLLNEYGTETKLLVQLELTDEAGRLSCIVTDGTWAWSSDGPISFADNKDGEVYDARRKPSYKGTAQVTSCKVVPTASDNVPLTEHERFTPVSVITTPSGKKVLDFGQNIAGYVAFSLKARAGQKLKLRFGEMFDENGEFTQKNFQCVKKERKTPLQQIEYTCREGVNNYKTKFAIFGFQYVLVEGDVAWGKDDFTAIAVYSDMESTVSFDSSHALLNKFVENTRWSAKNNHADIPTDCPTRERHGWTGDAQIFVKTACYFFDYDAMARKYVTDMCDGQRQNGCFRQITPPGGVDSYMNAMDGSAGWSDAGVLIPYMLYKMYGDTRVLKRNYEAMKRYADYKIKTLGRHYMTSLPTGVRGKYRKYISNYGQSYGEWSEPADVHPFAIADFVSPHPEETTAYVVYMLEKMAEVAAALQKTEDEKRFKEYAEKARIGYQKLVSGKKFSLDTDRQAKLVRPLYMRLLDKSQETYAKDRLIKALENYRWRLGTGFLSTPFILYVLTELDPAYAYRLLENEERPGWLFMVKAGANTIWEGWEGTDSRDHYSKGAVCEWLFSEMCGINVVGENAFRIAPVPGGHFIHAKTEYISAFGKVSCGWEKTEKGYSYRISVPANTTAELLLPDGRHETLIAGDYSF